MLLSDLVESRLACMLSNMSRMSSLLLGGATFSWQMKRHCALDRATELSSAVYYCCLALLSSTAIYHCCLALLSSTAVERSVMRIHHVFTIALLSGLL
jgi:hypothetical protein